MTPTTGSPMSHPLENPAWHTLSVAHRASTVGSESARRYLHGFAPPIAFAEPAQVDLSALTQHTAAGELLYGDGWTGPMPADWELVHEVPLLRLVWRGAPMPLPLPLPKRQPWRILDARDADQAVALALATRPGPFGPRSLELGEYLGLFDGKRLVAMAGERMKAAAWREISGVCTAAEYEGRGHARILTSALVQRQLQRGEIPFLHVMADNRRALLLYQRLGFVYFAEAVVRAIRLRLTNDAEKSP